MNGLARAYQIHRHVQKIRREASVSVKGTAASVSSVETSAHITPHPVQSANIAPSAELHSAIKVVDVAIDVDAWPWPHVRRTRLVS